MVSPDCYFIDRLVLFTVTFFSRQLTALLNTPLIQCLYFLVFSVYPFVTLSDPFFPTLVLNYHFYSSVHVRPLQFRWSVTFDVLIFSCVSFRGVTLRRRRDDLRKFLCRGISKDVTTFIKYQTRQVVLSVINCTPNTRKVYTDHTDSFT